MWWPGINRQHLLARGGPVAAWLFWEGAGRVVGDVTGNGYDADFQSTMGTSGWIGSPYGGVLRFPAVDQYSHIAAPASAPLIGDNYSYVFRVRPTSVTGFRALINKYADPWTDGMLIMNGAGNLWVFASSTSQKINVAGYFVLNEWMHGAVTFSTSGSPVRGVAYKNGRQVDSDNTFASLSTTATPFRIGEQDGTSRMWSGDIDFVYVFPYTLTPHDVWHLYENPYEMFRIPSISRRHATAPPPAQPMPIMAAKGIHSVIYGGLVLQG